MANTPNLGLYKPNRADEVEVDVSLANNFDIIDVELNKAQADAETAFTKATAAETAALDLTTKVNNNLNGLAGVQTRLSDVEYDVGVLKSGGGGSGTGTPAFIDGGSFLDTYASQTSGVNGGEF